MNIYQYFGLVLFEGIIFGNIVIGLKVSTHLTATTGVILHHYSHPPYNALYPRTTQDLPSPTSFDPKVAVVAFASGSDLFRFCSFVVHRW